MSTSQADEPTPTTLRVHQAGTLAAIARRDGAFLMPAIKAMPAQHPSKRRVSLMAMIAGAILRGEVPGPYVDDEAEALAEILLADEGAMLLDVDERRAS